jgi:hypothetical protein
MISTFHSSRKFNHPARWAAAAKAVGAPALPRGSGASPSEGGRVTPKGEARAKQYTRCQRLPGYEAGALVA